MSKPTTRLYFIDAIRAWAILMMLQGHFIDGLLDNAFRDGTNTAYGIWKYFRGITAPVFFTVSGFIFTYLLVRDKKTGFKNPRVKKGIRRGLELLFIGYLLRTNLWGLLSGQIYDSFYLVDVLHCIGLSLLGIIGIYLITYKRKKQVFALVLTGIALLLFLFEPVYKQWGFTFLPQALANYLTKANGSVFTLIPWFGYAAIGASLSLLFTKYRDLRYFYPLAITLFSLAGYVLIYFSSDAFLALSRYTGIQLFADIYFNNYLFIRLGNVLLVFAIFMLLRGFMKNRTLLRIGQSTLSIYVVHFIILYGSFTGLGLYRYLHHSLTPHFAVPGALLFIIVSTYTALRYEDHKEAIKRTIAMGTKAALASLEAFAVNTYQVSKPRLIRFLRRFRPAKN
ncbi:heparan-alpha-glucosaminide N-acetyltransferase domain-containing protein [Pseudozobellia thermophila]|uniref:Heparan-alpha-glucosaminide N-acetyltransferase catalytic domain-containing protein n=1 Tax=Pseudozobellia thermophila TaxID=192903 RepID=A0A1M6N4C2_9FLAO|nr:heparan-alpha-glucosaminide N-acetyltransferase domain-containing protein [Pseudozobellia thermophila]SHJ90571.1 Protein of unknown function [Pseudozobellia thermophila]